LRNNSGCLKDKEGRLVRYGLGNTSEAVNRNFKSSDLIGITVKTVTQDMVGQKIAVFTAIEVKSQAWKPSMLHSDRERGQNQFIAWVLSLGGYAGFAKSVDDFRNIIRR
jgi:hypothetical protein